MRPPRCASSEHKELLRDVHGSWDCGHWRNFIDVGQTVTQLEEQAVLTISNSTLLSSGLIFDTDSLYTFDYPYNPRSRGLSEHGVFSCEEYGIPGAQRCFCDTLILIAQEFSFLASL